MTIHPLRLTGLVIGCPRPMEYLEKMQDRVIKFITRHSQIGEERLRELMFHPEIWYGMSVRFSGKDAVEEGLIDAVGGISAALAKLKELIGE